MRFYKAVMVCCLFLLPAYGSAASDSATGTTDTGSIASDASWLTISMPSFMSETGVIILSKQLQLLHFVIRSFGSGQIDSMNQPYLTIDAISETGANLWETSETVTDYMNVVTNSDSSESNISFFLDPVWNKFADNSRFRVTVHAYDANQSDTEYTASRDFTFNSDETLKTLFVKVSPVMYEGNDNPMYGKYVEAYSVNPEVTDGSGYQFSITDASGTVVSDLSGAVSSSEYFGFRAIVGSGSTTETGFLNIELPLGSYTGTVTIGWETRVFPIYIESNFAFETLSEGEAGKVADATGSNSGSGYIHGFHYEIPVTFTPGYAIKITSNGTGLDADAEYRDDIKSFRFFLGGYYSGSAREWVFGFWDYPGYDQSLEIPGAENTYVCFEAMPENASDADFEGKCMRPGEDMTEYVRKTIAREWVESYSHLFHIYTKIPETLLNSNVDPTVLFSNYEFNIDVESGYYGSPDSDTQAA